MALIVYSFLKPPPGITGRRFYRTGNSQAGRLKTIDKQGLPL